MQWTILANENKHGLFGKHGLVEPSIVTRFVHPPNYTLPYLFPSFQGNQTSKLNDG